MALQNPFYQRFKNAQTLEQKQRIAQEFHQFYEAISDNERITLIPFLEQLKASIEDQLNAIDPLVIRAEAILSKLELVH